MAQHEDIGKPVVDRTLWNPDVEYKLEVFPNRNPDKNYIISFNIPEYTSLCPWSGFPDFATIKIAYIPSDKCVELKALKLYINAFRNTRISHETVPNRILNDFMTVCNPKYIKVTGDFGIRGNIKTIIRTEARTVSEPIEYLVKRINSPEFDYEKG